MPYATSLNPKLPHPPANKWLTFNLPVPRSFPEAGALMCTHAAGGKGADGVKKQLIAQGYTSRVADSLYVRAGALVGSAQENAERVLSEATAKAKDHMKAALRASQRSIETIVRARSSTVR